MDFLLDFYIFVSYFFMKFQEHTETEFIGRLHNGDSVAFTELYDEFSTDILFYIKKMVGGDTDVADGIVSETFTKLWTRINNFPSISNIRSFLYVTSRWMALDWLHRQKIRPDISESSLPVGMPEAIESSPIDENASIKIEAYKRLYKALDSLKPAQQEILKRLFLEEKSIKEICKELNISPEAARQNKSKGLKNLRNNLGDLSAYLRHLNWYPILLLLLF